MHFDPLGHTTNQIFHISNFFYWFNGTEKYEPHLTFAYRVCFVYLLYKGMMQSNLVTIENEGF